MVKLQQFFLTCLLQMADPLTALMYAVQVMNFLKTLVVKTLREREESIVKSNPVPDLNSFDDDGNHSNSEMLDKEDSENGNDCSDDDEDTVFVTAEPSQQSPSHLTEDGCETETATKSKSLPASTENYISSGNRLLVDSCPCNLVSQICSLAIGLQDCGLATGQTKGDQAKICRSKSLQLSTYDTDKCSRKVIELPVSGAAEKNCGMAIIERINSRTELAEAWR